MARHTMLLGALALLVPSLALAGPLDDRVEEMLQGIESTPKAAEWKSLPPEAAPLLAAIAKDPKALPTKRARAVHALAYFPTAAESETTLAALVDDAHTEITVRRSAARAYAAGFKDRALPHLTPLVEDANPRLREEAVKAVASIPGANATDLLKRRAPVERDPAVKAALTQALQTR
jgi:hypothetical protein